MLRKFFTAILFVSMLFAGTSYAVTVYDPYHLYPYDVTGDNDNVYSRYGNLDYGFYYQLRDVTGATRTERVSGPQWFATVYENYFWFFYNQANNTTDGRTLYRRTLGGEMPAIHVTTGADLLNNFNYILVDEPEPYNSWIARNINPTTSTTAYDIYPDPLESLCLVITNGQGEFNVDFTNQYARHFPFWWGYGRGPSYGNYTYDIHAPIEYVVSGNTITNSLGTNLYNIINSGDRGIYNTSGTKLYVISGDNVYDTNNTLAYYVSGDVIYNSSNERLYTIETSTLGSSTYYICNFRPVEQSVYPMEVEGYQITARPVTSSVLPGDSMTANINLRNQYGADDYGSRLGYIAFRQQADFDRGYNGFRESSRIPVVVANVSNGNATGDTPLEFDMIVYNSGDVVNRIKFTWSVEADKPDQDLGTFFMMQQYNTATPVYDLETQITNNSGTRYQLQRYDMINPQTGDDYRGNYVSIRPDYWRYNLTPDLYGTLPDHFMLDTHSQIAPGLVTIYHNNIGSGYRTINTNYDTSESFRLYEYSGATPRNLRLLYKRVAGMTTAGPRITIPVTGGSVGLQGFRMQFADVIQNDDETEYQLMNIMGKSPVMISATDSAVVPVETYINSTALDGFSLLKTVPEGLVTYEAISSGDTSVDVATNIPLQPVAIRMRIPRRSQLLNTMHSNGLTRWEYLDTAENSRQLFTRFAEFGSIWVRVDSSIAREVDTNLFTAINNKGSSIGVSAQDCVKAFTYNDELYLDFIALIADAKSTRSGSTAYIETFKDDNVPYILIGDGSQDSIWNLKFYIGAAGANPDIRTPVTSGDTRPTGEDSGDGGGGGCDLGISGILGMIILFGALKFSARQ